MVLSQLDLRQGLGRPCSVVPSQFVLRQNEITQIIYQIRVDSHPVGGQIHSSCQVKQEVGTHVYP
jgi:hypothetical protein